MILRRCLFCLAALASSVCSLAEDGAAGTERPGYQVPPEAIVKALDALDAQTPIATASPGGRWLLLQYPQARASINEFARPLLGLGGWTFDASNARALASPFRTLRRLSLIDASSGREWPLDLPDGQIGYAEWSRDGRLFALMRSTNSRTELWIGDAHTRALTQIANVSLNATRTRGDPINALPCRWLSNNTQLLCLTIPAQRATLPMQKAIAPRIQDSRDRAEGTAAPRSRPEHRLQSVEDEALYEYHMTAQPAVIDVVDRTIEPIGSPAIYETLEPSPDGALFLSVRIVRPYSYLTIDREFPKVVEILNRRGQVVRLAAKVAGAAGASGPGGVSAGPRSFFWRPGVPATLGWYEALDGGDPRVKVPNRDRLLLWPAPFKSAPRELFRSAGRMSKSSARTLWGRDDLVIIEEIDSAARIQRVWQLSARARGAAPRLFWQFGTDKPHENPGEFVTTLAPGSGRGSRVERLFDGAVLLQDASGSVYLSGTGYSPEGTRPFLDRYDLRTGRRERLFESRRKEYEAVISVLDPAAHRLLTSIETPSIPPNLRIVESPARLPLSLTHSVDPAPELTQVQRQRVTYHRDDGVQLNGDLYLPHNYTGGRLPLIVSAYPTGYSGSEGAEQRVGTENRFPARQSSSLLPLVMEGYAVFEAAMPVVGAQENFNAQIAANAQAAVEKLVALGVADRRRIGITGQSYGGLMTATLLAHTDLFAAGVARSGAYNLTLSPFGFQEESRSFWQARHLYDEMSPFRYADRIRAPLLLVHGEWDNSAGANLIQSARFFEAMHGLGKTARLVVLPYEKHQYQARESVLHFYAEMLAWFDRYLKPQESITAVQSK